MKLLPLNSNISISSYDQNLADIIKWTLLRSPEKHPHTSKFIKYLSFMTLDGETLLKIKMFLVANVYAF